MRARRGTALGREFGALGNSRGSALLEVLLASMLLTMVLLPLISSLGVLARGAQRSRVGTVAANLLQDRAELIKFNGIYSVPAPPGTDPGATTWTVSEASYNGAPITVEITVTVTSMSGVRKFLLKAFREPGTAGATPVATLELVIYEQGI